MKRRVRFTFWLFDRSRTARLLFASATWPFVYVADRWRGYDPPARLSDALDWAKRGTR